MKRNFLIYFAFAFLFEMFNLCFALGNLGGDLDAKLAELARQIESNMAEGKKAKIAVIEFSDLNGNITDFGKFLSEELITRLFMTKRFEVVERQLLSKVIAEHKLTLSGFVDPNSAKELGKILGVDAIATGTITDLDATVKINARLIATDTGSIFAVASVEVIKDETIRRLLSRTEQDNTKPPQPKPSSSVDEEVVYLSDFQPTRVQVYANNFERDVSNDKGKIVLNNVFYKKGLFTHAPALVSYILDGKYLRFESYVGLWDSGNPNRGKRGDFAGTKGSVIFEVWVDSQKKYDSGVLLWNNTEHISISVEGGVRMDLIVREDGNGTDHDWSVWGDAKLIKRKQ